MSDDESMNAEAVLLGFAEEAPARVLSSDRFPSKIGGKPSWLALENLPNTETDLTCDECKEPMNFLMQVYSPGNTRDDTFHRTVFVFCCRNGTCHSKAPSEATFRVLRSQLKRDNRYYAFDPPPESDEDDEDSGEEGEPKYLDQMVTDMASQYGTTCHVCGCRSTKVCGKCNKVRYCSRAHQVFDWRHGHKDECTNLKEDPEAKPSWKRTTAVFPQYEIVSEPEPTEEEAKESDYSKENKLYEKYKEQIEAAKAAGEADVDEEDDIDEGDVEEAMGFVKDKAFLQFQKRVGREPQQVLRVCAESEEGPLWISKENVPKDSDIPPCKHCNGPRKPEFQIMPQLLYMLDVDKDAIEGTVVKETLDWGTLVVYTCAESCEIPDGEEYVSEFIWKQNVSKPKKKKGKGAVGSSDASVTEGGKGEVTKKE